MKLQESDHGVLRLLKDESVEKEGYHLQIKKDEIKVTASDDNGVIHALTTLYQMGREVDCVEIEDAPKYDWRGLHLDCSRHFFSADEVKRVIEEMSLVKLNKLHWHLSDDQGWRIESRKFPKLQEVSEQYYTQEEIRDIVHYAKVRGVEVIPEIDMPGHTSAILAAYPEYSCFKKEVKLAKTGGIYPIVLCTGSEDVYDFLESLLSEIVPLFDSKWFHIGGDETPDREWKACPVCQSKMQEMRHSDTRSLQGYFSGRVKKVLDGMGKHVIFWNDSLEAENLDKENALIQYWSIQYADTMEKYIEEGGKYIYSDMFDLYFDYPSAMMSLSRVYSFIPEIRSKECREGLEGMEACLWSEHLDTNETLEQYAFPRAYALAEKCWSEDCDLNDFTLRVKNYIEKRRMAGIFCQSYEEAEPEGEAKKNGIMAFMGVMQNSMDEETRKITLEFTKPSQEFSDRFQKKFFGR